MEYSLTKLYRPEQSWVRRLNPCSNGILSDYSGVYTYEIKEGLNPCSNGILSDKIDIKQLKYKLSSLNPCSNGILSDNLKESVLDFSCFFSLSFNPFPVRELVPSEKFFANVCEFILHSK